MTADLPDQARVVIVGGGIIGCSIAYHLTKLGWSDVVLLERGQLTCGTTWHAAGLVMQLRSNHTMTQLSRYGAELYGSLEAETGQATGFRRNGSLVIARTDERFIEIRRMASLGHLFGVDVEIVTPDQAAGRWPLADKSRLAGGIWVPGDGTTNPVDTTMALARGARNGGARLVEDARVTGIKVRDGGAVGVETATGEVACEKVVLCAGLWSRELAAGAGVNVPLYAAEHMYAVTGPMDGVQADLPVLRDPDGYIYIKEEAGKLLVGAFEPDAKPLPVEALPGDPRFVELQEDWDQFELPMRNAIAMVPALEHTEIRRFFNGPESFTPDNKFIVGEAPEVRNLFVAAGFNSQGILSGAGVGKALSEWITEGRPTVDLSEIDIARFQRFQTNKRYLHERTRESLGLLYGMHWPHRQVTTARPVRMTPLYERLKARGACFGEAAGWERANWYAPEGIEPRYEYSFGRQNWFEHSGREHRAVRNDVGLLDLSSFAKFELAGRDATQQLQAICANDVDVAPGKIVYTGMLNERGGFEADLTVTRLDEDRYLLITAAASQTRDFHWLRRHLDSAAHVHLSDLTSAFSVLAVMGPKSRELLSRVSDADLSNAAFPFATAREIDVGYARALAMRVTYVGELGWELYLPSEFAVPVFDLLLEHGKELDIRLAGYHALDSLRSEKGYRHWGHDIGPDDTPLEAGLGFAVAWDKGIEFNGREALLKQKQRGIRRRLVHFLLDDSEPLLIHDEPVWRDGKLVGRITSGAFGHMLGRSVGMGYIEHAEAGSAEFINAGRYELELAAERFPARVSLRPFYDPENERVKA